MVKLICYCPPEAEELILQTLGDLGVGQFGLYDHWSLSSEVTETFRPLEGANPSKGKLGRLSRVQSRRLEFQCAKADYLRLVEAIKQVHPYQTPAIEVWALLYP
ncbi:MAG: hypothetical protein A2527_13225 [Candidatus Lambdaproteobacteria bacterium RIFOXYD2_FULL_50_16]|uniref:NGG1p interacting factor NIF3 n=1 Tax=Candidatus Lambdaproteobacteria bacterium RIFOXYD2_FULL_50_16 TaxID=1817772 RepID=A0A1F6GG81_9PROT|nr:MAG: hypothetical protein A2527_13225 [Candidatus Lambdaproteobacteria bacterium RIFOXYD2_FULL_50_16]